MPPLGTVKDVYREIYPIKPTLIVGSAGVWEHGRAGPPIQVQRSYTHLDALPFHFFEPHAHAALALACASMGIPCVRVSTGHLFGGLPRGHDDHRVPTTLCPDLYGTPTPVPDLTERILDVAERGLSRVWHVGDGRVVSAWEWGSHAAARPPGEGPGMGVIRLPPNTAWSRCVANRW